MDDFWATIVAYVLVIGVILGISMLTDMPNRVTDDDSVVRFSELAQVPVEKVQIVRHSNNTLPWGDLHDVTYELMIEGKSASGRCTSGWMGTSPLICRLYWGTGPAE